MAQKNGRVRIIDIARVMGLSKSTVSRALMDSGRVSPQTVEAVRKTARELGYIRDRGAAELGGCHNQTIGLVIRTTDLPFYNQLAVAVYQESERIGAEVLMVHGTGNLDRQLKVLHSLLERRVDGIIVASGRANPEAIAEVSQICPMVVLGLDQDIPLVDTVVTDPQGEIDLALEVVKAGHKKVGVIETTIDLSFTLAERAERMKETLCRCGVEVVKLQKNDSLNKETLKEILLAYQQGMTAIMAGNDTQALLLLRYFQHCGIRVPDDISVTGFDGSSGEVNDLIGLTTWCQPLSSLAKQGVEYLIDRIENPKMEQRRMLFPGQLYFGRTLSNYPVK